MIKDLYSQLHYIPQAIALTIMLIMSFMFVNENNDQVKNKIVQFIKSNAWLVGLLFYTALLLTGTLLGRPLTYPLKNIVGHIGFVKDGKINIGALENILIFIPYTFLYCEAVRPRNCFINCFLLSIGTTVFIELFQLLFWLGQFSVADMIHNTIGGLAGCMIWFLFNKVTKHNQKGMKPGKEKHTE